MKIENNESTYRIDINQAHLGSTQRLFQPGLILPFFLPVPIILQPLSLIPPKHIFLGSKRINSPPAKPQRFRLLPSFMHHRFQRDISGENDQVCPAYGLAVLLLDGPEDVSPGLVEVCVVGPGVEWSETNVAAVASSAAVESLDCRFIREEVSKRWNSVDIEVETAEEKTRKKPFFPS